jgi:hypothetical protein
VRRRWVEESFLERSNGIVLSVARLSLESWKKKEESWLEGGSGKDAETSRGSDGITKVCVRWGPSVLSRGLITGRCGVSCAVGCWGWNDCAISKFCGGWFEAVSVDSDRLSVLCVVFQPGAWDVPV